jgi:hydrogenase maturation protease
MSALQPFMGVNLLVIGYGNTLRSDDGVGPRTAEAVAAMRFDGVETLSCHLLTPELAEPISRAEAVVFVDAAVDEPREVRLRLLEPAATSRFPGHAADPAVLLALARDVYGHTPRAWLLTIPAENTAIGEALSESTRRSLREALGIIRGLAAGPSSR